MAASRSQISRDPSVPECSPGRCWGPPGKRGGCRLRCIGSASPGCGLGQIVVAGHRGSVNESDALASLLQQQVAWLARSARATQLPNLER